MEIVSRGESRRWSAFCQAEGCRAELIVDDGDLFQTYSPELYGHSTHCSFRCPCCGTVQVLPQAYGAGRGSVFQNLYNPEGWTPPDRE